MNESVAQANRHAEVIQAKAFTVWVNSHLAKVNQPKISDLIMDLQDGVVLCHLIGHLTHQKVRGFTAKPRSPAHKMANISLALDTAEAAGLRLDSLGAQDVYDMNTKLVLGFVWSLISKYPVVGSASDAKEATRSKLEQLAGEPVANITSAFGDGILLAKMIDRKKKGLLHPETMDPSKGKDNVGTCLYLLENQFKMPHVLDAGDICGQPDEKAMLTFWPYVIEAIEGRALVAESDHAPAVFNRAASPAPVAPVSPAAPAPSSSNSNSNQAAPRPASSPAGGHSPSSGPAVRRLTPSRNYSVAVSESHPGIKFSAVTLDGKGADSSLPCQQCGGELGSGRVFKFANPEPQYIHSRCFDCSVCRKDFLTGFFYLSAGKLLCTQHAMESFGLVCKACSEPISDFAITALEAKWHEDCFKCHGSCKRPFVEPKFFNGNGFPYCDVCHAALNGRVCHRCKKGCVQALKAMDKYWHDACFSCNDCKQVITANYVESDGWPYHSDCLAKNEAKSARAAEAAAPPRAAPSPAKHDEWVPPVVARPAPAPAPGGGCGVCTRDIPQGEAVTVSGRRYHRECFACALCKSPIKGSFFSVKEGFCCPACEKNLPPEVEGGSVPCEKCGKVLVGSVIKALGKEYHKECFGCSVCGKLFTGGS